MFADAGSTFASGHPRAAHYHLFIGPLRDSGACAFGGTRHRLSPNRPGLPKETDQRAVRKSCSKAGAKRNRTGPDTPEGSLFRYASNAREAARISHDTAEDFRATPFHAEQPGGGETGKCRTA